MALLISKNAAVVWFFIALALLLWSLAVWMFPANEYELIGIYGAVDCDGPLSVLIFSIPLFASCLTALFLFPRVAWFKGIFGIALPFSLLLSLIFSAITIAQTIQQQQAVAYQESCGAKL